MRPAAGQGVGSRKAELDEVEPHPAQSPLTQLVTQQPQVAEDMQPSGGPCDVVRIEQPLLGRIEPTGGTQGSVVRHRHVKPVAIDLHDSLISGPARQAC